MSVVPLPVANLIPLLSTGAITLRRRGQPTLNTLGERVPGAFVDIVIAEAVVHPASEAALEQISVTNRANDHVEIYVDRELRTAQGSNVPDEILYSGHWYKVVGQSNYQLQGGASFALAERIKST